MTNRRHFLHTAAAFATLPALLLRSLRAADSRPAPSQRLGVGVIGLGDRGGQHLGALLGLPDVQVVGVCDPFRPKAEQWKTRVEQHYAAAQPGSTYRGCAALQDFRELLARPDLDAVFIAAPENWHALMSLAALRAGKDVYCEKALALTVAEGRAMCDGVRRYGRVFQTGTQQRSERGFRLACELARNGHLGKVHTVKVSVPGGRALPLAPPKTPPPEIDYELWLGPAPWTPYNDVKCTYNWYFISDYCAGWIQSWGVHHIDIALWGQPALMDSTLAVETSRNHSGARRSPAPRVQPPRPGFPRLDPHTARPGGAGRGRPRRHHAHPRGGHRYPLAAQTPLGLAHRTVPRRSRRQRPVEPRLPQPMDVVRLSPPPPPRARAFAPPAVHHRPAP